MLTYPWYSAAVPASNEAHFQVLPLCLVGLRSEQRTAQLAIFGTPFQSGILTSVQA